MQLFFIGLASAAVFDKNVERSKFIGDSVIVELNEGKYQFKILADFIYEKLSIDKLSPTISHHGLKYFCLFPRC